MKRFVLVLVMGLLVVANSFATDKGREETVKGEVESVEATYVLNGTIIDGKTNEAVSGATITINGTKYYSDFSGNFSVPALSKGSYNMSVDFISYQSQKVQVVVDNTKELTIQMEQR